jgi:hypothetical protein
VFEAALRRLLSDPQIGGCWLVERAGFSTSPRLLMTRRRA